MAFSDRSGAVSLKDVDELGHVERWLRSKQNMDVIYSTLLFYNLHVKIFRDGVEDCLDVRD